MIDDLKQIAIFAKAIDHGSFRGAAAELHLSPSVVSHHISQLEEKLGVALIYRSTRKLTLTSEGARLLDSGHLMLGAVEGTLNDLRDTAKSPSGELRVALPSVLSPSPLMANIAAFQTRYPKISIQLDFSDERTNIINEGYDIAIRMSPERKRGANRQSLFETRRCLVAATDYLRGKPLPKHPKDLEKLNWLGLSAIQNSKATWRKDGMQTAHTTAKPSTITNDAQALYRLARAGAGIAIVPDFLVGQDAKDGLMQILLSDWEIQTLDTFAEWPPNAPKGGIARLFVSWLAQAQNP